MGKTSDAIGVLQALMIIITAVGIIDHVTVIPVLMQAAERDSWVATLLAGVLLFCWIPLIYYIMKRTEQGNLFVWLKTRCGSTLAWIIASALTVDLVLTAVVTLVDVSNWTRITYLPKTPHLVIVFAFALVCFYAAKSGIRSIAIANGILLPLVVLFGFFVMTSNIPNKDYTLLWPVLEKGYAPVLKGMIYAGAGFSGLIMMLFMQHRLRSNIKMMPLLITGAIIVNLTLSPVTGGIAEFGPYEAARQRFTAFEEWRLVTFGHYLEHVDFLSIYQWLVGSFIRISTVVFLIPELFHITDERKRTRLLVVLFLLVAVMAQLPFSDMQFLQFLKNVYLPFECALLVGVSFILALAVSFGRERKLQQ